MSTPVHPREPLGITQRPDGTLHLAGFPDAVKLIKVEGAKARRLADLALHRSDLKFASDCLDALETLSTEQSIAREAVWRAAIVFFFKCFGESKSRRYRLLPEKIYREGPASNRVAFTFFESYRNKHLVHDESPLSQCPIGAAVNGGQKEYKIEGVVALPHTCGIDGPENRRNLQVLIGRASAWAAEEFQKLQISIGQDLEQDSYEVLIARPPVETTVPTIDDIHQSRT